MKEGFVTHTGIDQKHNDIHRQAYMRPETDFVTTTIPTVDSMRLGERRIYNDGSKVWLFCKISKNQLAKMEWTLI